MEIVVRFLYFAQLLHVAMLYTFVVIGVVLFIVALYRKSILLGIIAIILGTFQYVLPLASNRHQIDQIAARKAEVAAFPRIKLSRDYPRTLVVYGELPEPDVRDLMILGYFDRVQVRDSFENVFYSNADQSEKCRQAVIRDKSAAMPVITGVEMTGEERKKTVATIKKCGPSHQPFMLGPDRLLVRMGMYVTRRANDRRAAPRAIQVDLVDKAGEHLVLYEEMPTLDYPRSATQLLPEGYEYPCYGFDNRRVIENLIDAARHPEEAEEIMERPGLRGYCVRAAGAVPEKDEEAAQNALEAQQDERIKTLWGRGALRDTTSF